MIETPRIIETRAREAAVIRLTIPKADIQKEMGPAISEVIQAVTAQGVGQDGPVFSHHFRMDPKTWDFVVGVPVREAVTPSGRVQRGTLPGRARVAFTTYVGGYEGIGEGWGELMAWMGSNGHEPAEDLWESYARGPETGQDPSTWRTELFRPLTR